MLPAVPTRRSSDLQSVPPGLPLQQEGAAAADAADEGEAQEVEGLRLAEPAPGAPGRGEAAELDQAGLDRKSTRLNSSHANISYAVFCLKKKNRCRTVQAIGMKSVGHRYSERRKVNFEAH